MSQQINFKVAIAVALRKMQAHLKRSGEKAMITCLFTINPLLFTRNLLLELFKL